MRFSEADDIEGVNLIYLLIEEYGLKTVQDYMLHVRLPSSHISSSSTELSL